MPTVNVANPSTRRQVRWCVCPMPLSEANLLPAQCLVNGRFPAVKAEVLGTVTQLWHVKCDIPGKGTLSLTDWKPSTQTLPAFAPTPWVTDAPDREMLRVAVYENGAWVTNIQLDKPPVMVSSSPVSQTWEYRDHTKYPWSAVHGYSAVVWVTRWLGQDALDIRGAVTWSNPTTAEWSKPDVQFLLASGKWPVVGEPFALYNAAHNGSAQWAPNWLLFRDKLPFGCSVTFRGVMMPQDDGPLPITIDEQAGHLLDAQRASWMEAAAEGPLVAACDWTAATSQGDWLAFGRVPQTAVRADRDAVIAAANKPGTYWGVRPFANQANHGGTGDQPPFGAMKDLVALQGDPWRVYELMDSALDYWRRCCHLRELDGTRITKATRPGVQTWQGTVEPKMSPDTLGKPAADPPYGWDSAGPRSVLMDDQHRGDAFLMCVYALTGDPLLLECIRDMLAVDEMRAMPARGWFDGPRACGRLWQFWAKCMVLLSGSDRELAIRLAEAERSDRQKDQDTWNYSPVHVVEWKPADSRVLPGDPFSVPWNDSLFVLGLHECAAALTKLGRPQDAERFARLAEWVGVSIIKWSSVHDTNSGLELPINGLRWLPGGAANDAAYYVFPRAGAGYDSTTPINMLVGSFGWWTWFAGSLHVALGQSTDTATRDKAAGIWNALLQGADVRTLEWLAM